MALKPDHPTQRPCSCGGANPACLHCGGTGVIDDPGFRPIMAGPVGIRRRPYVPRDSVGTSQGPPEPIRCPHCGLEILNLAVHLAEAHPDQPQGETAAEREAREREEARQAAVAAELARREAEAAQRKAEARARRQAVEGPQGVVAWPHGGKGIPTTKPSAEPRVSLRPADATAQPDPPPSAGVSDVPAEGGGRRQASGRPEGHVTMPERPRANPAEETWERMRRALAEQTVLTGVVRSRKPFGVFVALGGIDGLVRSRELRAEDARGEAPGLQVGQSVRVMVIGIHEDSRRVELSMRRPGESQTPPTERGTTGATARPAEGPMALAFRVAREKQKHSQ